VQVNLPPVRNFGVASDVSKGVGGGAEFVQSDGA